MTDTFFDSFTPAEIARICAAGTAVHVPEGWSPIWEKTPADKAYVILDGEVSVRKDGGEVARLGAGDIVGETALVQHSLRTATVVALTPLEMVHFTDDAVEHLRQDIPAFDASISRIARERLSA
jgi:CRP/FNR family transcriptional regulator, cyclic AMP receptor protein